MAATVTPGITPGESPAFFKIRELDFQDLCRDLLHAEPTIATASIYGVRGQKQRGIDVLATRANATGIEVGQCKCYESFTAGQIEKASLEFLKYWDEHWAKESVKRFILFVACDLDRTEQNDQVCAEIRRFDEHRIAYEAWSAATLRMKLRPHPALVDQYLGPYWVTRICGAVSPGPQPAVQNSAFMAAMSNQFDELARALSDLTARRVDELREQWRRGRRHDVLDEVRRLRADRARWVLLAPEVQAQMVSFEGGLALHVGEGVEAARRALEESVGLGVVPGQRRLRAMIAEAEGNLADGVSTLEGADDVESLNLKAILLLEAGELAACRRVAEEVKALGTTNAETLRISALAAILDGDLELSWLAIDKAVELASDWLSVRFSAAIVAYLSTLTASARPGSLPTWPEPVEWPLVRTEPRALSRARAAAHQLSAIACDERVGTEHRQAAMLWQIACLCNDPETQDAAAQVCRSALQVDPTNPAVLAWVVSRKLDVDLGPSTAALADRVRSETVDISALTALLHCHIAGGQPETALELLDTHRDAFEREGAAALHRFWRASSLARLRRFDDALAALGDNSDRLDLYARTVVLRRQAESNGQWQQYRDHLVSAHDQTGDPSLLLEACDSAARVNDWSFVAVRSADLLSLGTEDAIRLSAIADYNLQRYSECLATLDASLPQFRNGRLSAELSRLRVAAQHGMGMLPAAVKQAEELFREQATKENLLALARLYFSKGDLKSLSVLGRAAEQFADLDAREILELAAAIQWEDLRLAQRLFRRALTGDLPDELVGTAVNLGHQLGLDGELQPVVARLQDLGLRGAGGIRAVGLDALLELARRHRARAEELHDMYCKGVLPVHLLADASNTTLVQLYHVLLEDNASAPQGTAVTSLYARYGGRPMQDVTEDPSQWRLHVDITALLLAHQLGILPLVEEAFRPLHVPASLMPALLRMRQRWTPGQPAWMAAQAAILDLADRHRLEVLVGGCGEPVDQADGDLGTRRAWLLREARQRQGYYLTYVPLTKSGPTLEPAVVPDALASVPVNCRAVVEALNSAGALTEERYRATLAGLGTQGTVEPAQVIPEIGRPLLCDDNALELLALAGVLDVTCERFTILVTEDALQRLRNAAAAKTRADKTVAWLDELAGRIREGIDRGTYLVLPLPALAAPHDADTPESACVRALISYGAAPGDVVWIDDRRLNAHPMREGGTPIITFCEILAALRRLGKMTSEQYYDVLLKARRGGVRYLPITKDEILYHLRQAPIDNDGLLETPALACIRRYFARCVLELGHIQLPPVPEGIPVPTGEREFLESLARSAVLALRDVWVGSTDIDDRVCGLWSTWISRVLLSDHPAMVVAPRDPATLADADATFAVGVVLSRVLAVALCLDPTSRASKGRQRFLRWVSERILRRTLNADPRLALLIARSLGSFMIHLMSEARAQGCAPVVGFALAGFMNELPDSIRTELTAQPGLAGLIDSRFESIVNFQGVEARARDFWTAVQDAVCSGAGTLATLDGSAVRLEATQGSNRLEYEHPRTGQKLALEGEEFGVTHTSPQIREAALRSLGHWFDRDRREAEAAIADIATTCGLVERMSKARAFRDDSAEVYYRDFEERCRRTGAVTIDWLRPPSVAGLIRHLRLPADGTISTAALERAAVILLEEEGLEATASRMSGLPIAMPAPVLDAYRRMENTSRRRVAAAWQGRPETFLGRIHVARIVSSAGDRSFSKRVCRQLVMHILDAAGETDFRALRNVAQVVQLLFACWQETRDMSAELRLALGWTHTNRVYSTMLAAGVPADWIGDTFESFATEVPLELTEAGGLEEDVCHPGNMNRLSTSMFGLAHVLADDTMGVINVRLRRQLTDFAFHPKMNGLRLPRHELLRDATRASNVLGSFLAGDGGALLGSMLGQEACAALVSSFLQAFLEDALDKLAASETPPDDRAMCWLRVAFILGDRPPYPSLAARVGEAIAAEDFLSLADTRLDHALASLNAASQQLHHQNSQELGAKLGEALVSIAAKVRSNQTESQASSGSANARSLLSIALNLARAAPSSGLRCQELATTLRRLAVAWPGFRPPCKAVAERLAVDLPVAEGKAFWLLSAFCRA